jgi:hypothetical protein
MKTPNKLVFWIFILIILIILLILFLTNVIAITKYTPFTMNSEGEINSCKTCSCIGQLIIMESYPEQYNCEGYETCQNRSSTECQ